MTQRDRILRIVETVSEVPDLGAHLDARLYDLHLLDSLSTVELIVALSEEFGIDIAPTELAGDEWGTPRRIVEFVESKIGQ